MYRQFQTNSSGSHLQTVPQRHLGTHPHLVLQHTSGWMRGELVRDGAYLVPLRLFIGIGWLRAFAEKVAEPGWMDGTQLSGFLLGQVRDGRVRFPLYEWLIDSVFLPNVATLGWVVVLGQLLTRMAILIGVFTNAALLGGLFMNLNFLLAGVPDPSAFYIVIQTALLLSGTGAVLGVDAVLLRRLHHPLLVVFQGEPRLGRRWSVTALALCMVIGVYALAHVSDWSPGGSVRDPAMVLAVLAGIAGVWAFISYMDGEQPGETGVMRDALITRRLPVTGRASTTTEAGYEPTGGLRWSRSGKLGDEPAADNQVAYRGVQAAQRVGGRE